MDRDIQVVPISGETSVNKNQIIINKKTIRLFSFS